MRACRVFRGVDRDAIVRSAGRSWLIEMEKRVRLGTSFPRKRRSGDGLATVFATDRIARAIPWLLDTESKVLNLQVEV